MDKYIKNPVKLLFNPSDNNMSNELKRIFGDPLARTIWLGTKQRHVTNQYFEKNCLKLAKLINKDGAPDSVEKLEHIFNRSFGYGYSKEFMAELLPYLSGQKNLEYEVVNN